MLLSMNPRHLSYQRALYMSASPIRNHHRGYWKRVGREGTTLRCRTVGDLLPIVRS